MEISTSWIDSLVEGDLIRPNFDLSLAMGIEDQNELYRVDVGRKVVEITTSDALVVLGIDVDRSLDRMTITCLARGRPCQVVMMRYNAIRSFSLISHCDEREEISI